MSLFDVFNEAPYGPKKARGADYTYAYSDIFTVREELIRDLDPQPASVFEFGALVGFFLLTAVHAAPTIERAGWIDDERMVMGSNNMCFANLVDYRMRHERELELSYAATARESISAGTFDLVQVDGSHSYPDCFTDLVWAFHLGPMWIFVDDYKAFPEVALAVGDFCRWQGLEWVEHKTENGLAVIGVDEPARLDALDRRRGIENEPKMVRR